MSYTNSLREIYNLCISCSLYLNFNSALILMISGVYLGGGLLAADLGFLTGLSLMTLIYIADRLDVTEEDEINNPDRTALVRKYKTELFSLAVLSLGLFELSLAVSVFTPDVAGAVRVLLGHVPLFVLYIYDDIKTVPLPLDSLVVAFTWGYMLVFIFTFMSTLTVSPIAGAVLFTGWFLIVFAGLEGRNIKDIEGDRRTGKVTIAAKFGRQRTRHIEIALKGLGSAILVAFSNSALVFGLLVIHLLSLWFYGTLETNFRCDRQPTGQ